MNTPEINYLNISSDTQLRELADQMGIPNLTIIPRYKLRTALKCKHIKNIIVNYRDAPNGSHWVAINKTKKMYFDSYAQPMLPELSSRYKRSSTTKEIQSIDGSNCGQLSVLWLYYTNFRSNEDFYKLFKDVY